MRKHPMLIANFVIRVSSEEEDFPPTWTLWQWVRARITLEGDESSIPEDVGIAFAALPSARGRSAQRTSYERVHVRVLSLREEMPNLRLQRIRSRMPFECERGVSGTVHESRKDGSLRVCQAALVRNPRNSQCCRSSGDRLSSERLFSERKDAIAIHRLGDKRGSKVEDFVRRRLRTLTRDNENRKPEASFPRRSQQRLYVSNPSPHRMSVSYVVPA
jgi:hypothetical protein